MKHTFCSKVPPNRILEYRAELDREFTISIPQYPHLLPNYNYNAGKLIVIVPEAIPVGSTINLKIAMCAVALSKKRNTSGKVLSLSIPDPSASRILSILHNRELNFSIYTGSGFGMFLSLLLAYGLKPIDIGNVISKHGFPGGFKLFAYKNRFSSLKKLLRSAIPKIENVTLQDLKAEIFMPIVNASTGTTEVITVESHPDLPLQAACQLALANLLDFEPLKVRGKRNVEDSTALEQTGVLWGLASLSPCPDLSLFLFMGSKSDLKFETYSTEPKVEYLKPGKFKKGLSAYIQLEDVQRSIQASEFAAIMPKLVSQYEHIRLDSLRSSNNLTGNQVANLMNLEHRKQLGL